NQAVAKQGEFFGFGIHEESPWRERYSQSPAEGYASVVWGASGGPENRPERGATPVGSERRGPAQQVRAQIGKQEAVSRGPANGVEHVQGPGHEVGSRMESGQCSQC